jgi:hypothetical protein
LVESKVSWQDGYLTYLFPLTRLFITKESDQTLTLAQDHEKGYVTGFTMIIRCTEKYGSRFHKLKAFR